MLFVAEEEIEEKEKEVEKENEREEAGNEKEGEQGEGEEKGTGEGDCSEKSDEKEKEKEDSSSSPPLSSSSSTPTPPTPPPIPLALLPDCRSRALWLSALLDNNLLCDIVSKELLLRLERDLFVLSALTPPLEKGNGQGQEGEGREGGNRGVLSEEEEEELADRQVVQSFCEDIVLGIRSVIVSDAN